MYYLHYAHEAWNKTRERESHTTTKKKHLEEIYREGRKMLITASVHLLKDSRRESWLFSDCNKSSNTLYTFFIMAPSGQCVCRCSRLGGQSLAVYGTVVPWSRPRSCQTTTVSVASQEPGKCDYVLFGLWLLKHPGRETGERAVWWCNGDAFAIQTTKIRGWGFRSRRWMWFLDLTTAM